MASQLPNWLQTKQTKLSIHRLRLWVNLGCTVEERTNIQPVDVDLRIEFPNPPEGCITDSLEQTICYSDIVDALREKVKTQEFALVEKLAATLYETVQGMVSLNNKIYLKLTKVSPPVRDLEGGASFEIG